MNEEFEIFKHYGPMQVMKEKLSDSNESEGSVYQNLGFEFLYFASCFFCGVSFALFMMPTASVGKVLFKELNKIFEQVEYTSVKGSSFGKKIDESNPNLKNGPGVSDIFVEKNEGR